MSKFDPQDFQANPKKYELFRTAVVAANVFTHNGEHDLREGQHVGIKYRCTARNQLYKRMEPIYSLTNHDHDLYASTLKDFVL